MKKNIIQLHRGRVNHVKETITDDEEKKKDKQLFYRVTSESLGIGVSIALPIVGGVLVGSYLDRRFDTLPILTLTLLLLGIALGIFSLIRTVSRIQKN